MRIARSTVPFLSLFFLLTATAQAQRVEITPFAVLPFGGDFESDHGFLEPGFDVDDGDGYGLSLGFALSRSFQIELFWSHQDSGLVDPVFLGGFDLADLEIDYIHGGVLYQWGAGQFRPFVAGSLGVTEFSPADPFFRDETRFSVGLGAGAKVFFNRSFGLRLEARAFTTVIDEGDDRCGCGYYDDGTYFVQAELRGGLVFGF